MDNFLLQCFEKSEGWSGRWNFGQEPIKGATPRTNPVNLESGRNCTLTKNSIQFHLIQVNYAELKFGQKAIKGTTRQDKIYFG